MLEESKNQDLEIEKFVILAQKGDQEAFGKIYDLLVDQIYRYVYYRVQVEEVEDIVETVFLKTWENIRQYRSQKKSFSAWVFKIAHNLVVDHYRAFKDRVYDQLDPELPDHSRQHNPIKSAQSTFDNEVLKKVLSKMRKQYRDIILYKFINELSNREIAEILGKSEGSLRILQFRALKVLKQELENLGISY